MEKGAVQERVKRFIQGSGEGGQKAGELSGPRLEEQQRRWNLWAGSGEVGGGSNKGLLKVGSFSLRQTCGCKWMCSHTWVGKDCYVL